MRKKGFTLVELLVVVAIIGILATIVISSLGEARMKAKDTAIVGELRNLQTSIEVVTGATGAYTDICDETEAGGELALFRESVESKGGIWQNCQSDVNSYSVVVTLNSGQLADNHLLGTAAYAQLKKPVELIPKGDIPKGFDPKKDLGESEDVLLLSETDVNELKKRVRSTGQKFANPGYYCVGAVPPRTSEGNFRRGYLYSIPTIGCGIPVTNPDELINAYEGEDEEEEVLSADEIIASFSCPVTDSWRLLAKKSVSAGEITQLEVNQLIDSCNQEAECQVGACGDGPDSGIPKGEVDVPTKAELIQAFTCPIAKNWLSFAQAVLAAGEITQGEINDLLATCQVNPKGGDDGGAGKMEAMRYSRVCQYVNDNYSGSYTGCADNSFKSWVDQSFCEDLPPIQCR